MTGHPLLDLSQAETTQAAAIIRKLHQGQELVFKAITLEEPRKELVLKYFKAQDDGTSLPSIPRIAYAAYYLKGTVSVISRNEWWTQYLIVTDFA